jgi:hypothetical protein
MNEFDPRAIRFRKSGRDRRKADDLSYKGPERRLGKRRKKELYDIISLLERQAKGECQMGTKENFIPIRGGF